MVSTFDATTREILALFESNLKVSPQPCKSTATGTAEKRSKKALYTSTHISYASLTFITNDKTVPGR